MSPPSPAGYCHVVFISCWVSAATLFGQDEDKNAEFAKTRLVLNLPRIVSSPEGPHHGRHAVREDGGAGGGQV